MTVTSGTGPWAFGLSSAQPAASVAAASQATNPAGANARQNIGALVL
jgi:hypothetical protein